jgi:hypothetical protein
VKKGETKEGELESDAPNPTAPGAGRGGVEVETDASMMAGE